ncbi:hypothetical protein GCM10010287_37010 [Streptomyces variabilis]|uniref:Uncharacterized protein n=1 Tax=Streptomyces variabilis TaxID=67372 RepID=A0ABQ2U011_9ACTN|nr:hypothetical protein [Streptomyces variabilis]GGP75029.1 hypothetical protein GCM10010265_61950 [Streptomyces griseoincarnatus]GGT59394.1 hypothetical protein GCM10010287_37010 [Streptomyces variabilis]
MSEPYSVGWAMASSLPTARTTRAARTRQALLTPWRTERTGRAVGDGAGDDVLAAAGAGRPQAQSVDALAVEIIEDPAKREGADLGLDKPGTDGDRP